MSRPHLLGWYPTKQRLLLGGLYKLTADRNEGALPTVGLEGRKQQLHAEAAIQR
jgi:hypothetical protein